MKSNLVKDIISIVKTDEIKEEFNGFSKLVMDFILTKLNPYMYIIITIIVIIFLINIINIILIIILYRKQNKYFSTLLMYN
tara:strand:- start:241 stop:483 length:243 start_codon:yes stop_codon:yes gene_type:complete